MSAPVMYTPAEVARILGLHPQTVRRMCAARQIETLNISSGHNKARYLITEDGLRAFQRNRTIPALSWRP